MNPEVNWYFDKAEKWQEEINKLRTIVLDCGLIEELKWGCPCYMLERRVKGKPVSNVVLIHVFKEYCALLFFKGALLKDTNGILVHQTENVQSARQIRFTDVREIVQKESILKTYIYQAMEVEKAGLKVPLKKTSEFTIPEEFQHKLDQMPALKTAFEALTPGRQRGYIFHFSQAKQPKTREQRVEKFIPNILNGKGLDD